MTGATLGFASLFDSSNSSVISSAIAEQDAQGNGVVQMTRPLSASSAELSLQAAFEQAQQELLSFANRDDFESLMGLAFGRGYDAIAAEQFFEQLKPEEGANPFAQVSLVAEDQLNGANGVYVQATDDVYLSDALLSPDNKEKLVDVLLEELGHRLDAQINTADAAGDEGEIFARLVKGESLAPDDLEVLKTENDHLQLELGGLRIEAEANTAPQIIWRHYGVGQNLQWNLDKDLDVTGSSLDAIADVNWRIQGTGDFNGDGKVDYLLRHHGVGQNLVQYTDGNRQVIGAAALPAIPDVRWHIEGTGDFDQDGDSDIVLRHYATGQNLIWYMNGAAVERVEALPVIPDLNWNIEAVGDFNRDDNPDLVLRNRQSGQNLMWTMIGSTVQRSDLLPTIEDANWRIEGAGDFDQDGRTDLLLRHYGIGSNLIWTMEGAKVTGALGLPPIADTNWQPTVVGELPSKPPITFTSFNQNNRIVSDLSYEITWADQLSGDVRIDLYKGGEYDRIIAFTPSDGSYTWDSLSDRYMPEGDDYQIRISSQADASQQIFSPYFSVEKPYLQLNTPQTGEILRAGQDFHLTWTSNVGSQAKFSPIGGPVKVKIELYKAGQSQGKTTGLFGTDNDGSFIWTPPHKPEAGSDYQLEIAFNIGGDDFASLSQPFAILPKADLDIQLFNYNNTFNATQWQALNIAAQNWEKIITNDKEPDGNFRVVTFGSNDLGSREFAGAFTDNQRNGRKNFSNDNVKGTVDIGGVDYDNSVVWNLDLLPDLSSSDLIKIMMHELGHALGLGHEFGNANSLMDREYDIKNNETLVITDTSFSQLETLGYSIDRNAVNSLVWTI